MRFSIILLSVTLGSFVWAQTESQNIDVLLNESSVAFDHFESEKSLELAKSALEASLSLNDSEHISYSYYYIARALEDLGQQSESLKYLKLAEAQDFIEKDILLSAKIHELNAVNYMTINMYRQSISQFHKSLQKMNKIETDSVRQQYQTRIFGNLSVVHRDAANLDSSNFYLKKEISNLLNLRESIVYAQLSTSYLDFGIYYLEQKKDLDSAAYFIRKSNLLLDKYHDEFKHDIYRAWGDLYFEKKEYETSLDYYLKSLEIIENLEMSDVSYVHVYRRVSDIYKILGNFEKEQFYLQKYISFNDSILVSKENAVGTVVNKMIDEERKKHKLFQSRIYWLLLFLFFGFVVKTYLLIRYYKKLKRQKNKIETENISLLQEKEEKKKLEQKLNNAFDEVIQLAKENSPEFLMRFQEVYPHCYDKLIASYPNLMTSELKFCAMLYLNFSSKDIAEFTFVTPKAVQNRKNRLRKKMDIPSEEDLNIWMQKFCK